MPGLVRIHDFRPPARHNRQTAVRTPLSRYKPAPQLTHFPQPVIQILLGR